MELLESLPTKNKKINFKREIQSYARNWYWFVLSLFLFLLGAFLYLRYSEKLFLTKTTIKFPISSKSKNSLNALYDLQNLGMGISGNEEMLTEASEITSKPLLEKVVKNLDLEVQIYTIGNVKSVPVYNDAPFLVDIESRNPKFNGSEYILSPLGKDSFKLSGIDGVFRFNTIHYFPFGTARFTTKNKSEIKGNFKVQISSTQNAISKLEQNVKVVLPEKKGMIMELTMIGNLPERSEIILNEITKQYNLNVISEKNQEAVNTQKFLEDRLALIISDLTSVENQKEGYKKQNQIVDLESQAQLSLQNSTSISKEILNLNGQLELLNVLHSAASENSNQLMPTNLGLPSSVETLISEYNNLLITRNKTLKQATNLNPAVIEMNKEIAALQNLIRKSIADTRNNIASNIAKLKFQVNEDKNKISKLPSQEKKVRSIERELNLKEQLYLYLLQKREENAITLAVSAPKAKVINPAYTQGIVKPQSNQIYMSALVGGLLLPFGILFLIFSLDTKIHRKDDITEKIENANIIGEIPISHEPNNLIIANSFSVFAESFRILSTNLKFILKSRTKNPSKVILVTSSIKGEGKTTISMNTALAFAGKSKVIIIGADIRNPQLHRFIEKKVNGLTEYLISDDETPEKYIIPSNLHKNLDVLLSGAIAPNPNDLLDLPKFGEMLEYLKTKYEYIVIDSAPVMLVSDTMNILEYPDAILYVMKSEHTDKEILDYSDNFLKENQLKNVYFVLNSVRIQNSRFGGKYGGRYGYDYVSEKKKNKWWKKI